MQVPIHPLVTLTLRDISVHFPILVLPTVARSRRRVIMPSTVPERMQIQRQPSGNIIILVQQAERWDGLVRGGDDGICENHILDITT